MSSDTTVPQFRKPTIRGEEVEVLGTPPKGYTGPGREDGDVLVRYPDGSEAAAYLSEIEEGEPS